MTTAKTDIAIYQFQSDSAAWAFMRACHAAKLQVGYPSLAEQPTVQVAIPTPEAREQADELADGAPVVRYVYAGEAT